MDPVMIAKFKVERRTEENGGVGGMEMTVVCGHSEENDTFFKWTPWGQLKLGTLNKEALAEMKPGREFYVHFIPVPEPMPAAV